MCVVLPQSLCEAKRPSDLKVSPLDTTRPPVVCCWKRPKRKTDRGDREREKERDGNRARKKSENDMERNRKKHNRAKTVTQIQLNSRGKENRERGNKKCQDSQKRGEEE